MTSIRSQRRRLAAMVVATLVLTVACLDLTSSSAAQNPIAPPTTPASPDTPRPLSAPPFPAIPNASAIYAGPTGLYDVFIAVHGASLPSRYVLLSDSKFILQFSSARVGFFEYTGHYSRTDSLLTFSWDAWSIVAPWSATGIVRGDQLDVHYNDVMMMNDFIGGVYVLVR